MAFNAFLKIEGIDGESKDDKHKGEIDVLSFSWGGSQPGSPNESVARDARVNVKELNVVKMVDKSTPQLLAKSCGGGVFPTAVLTVEKVTDSERGAEAFYKLTLSDLLISSFSEAGNSQTEPLPMDQISFNFSKIEIELQTASGDTFVGACSAAFNKAL